MTKIAKSKFDSPDIHFIHGDMAVISEYFPGIKFDLVLSLFGSFSHTKNAKKVTNHLLNEITVDTGVIYLMTYSRFSFKNIYAFIKSLNWNKLSSKQLYNIRNSELDSACPAYFYSPNDIRKLFSLQHYYKLKFKTINEIFEIPMFKMLIKNLRLDKVIAILMLERLFLTFSPSLGHSLITILYKHA